MEAGSLTREIRIERIMPALPEKVFSAFTETQSLRDWWGPEGWTAPEAEIEPERGGKFNVVMKGPGLPGALMSGTILEIQPARHILIETKADAPDGGPGVIAQAKVTISPTGDGSKLTLSAKANGLSPSAAPMLAGMRAGWNQSLQKLEDLLAGRVRRQLVFQTLVPASPVLVWEAWATLPALEQWWGPDGFTLTNLSFDFHEGGEWRFTMHGPDGRDFPQRHLYTELLSGERLRYRHVLADFESTVTFDEMAGNTALTLRLCFASAEKLAENIAEYHADEGGVQALARLSALFET